MSGAAKELARRIREFDTSDFEDASRRLERLPNLFRSKKPFREINEWTKEDLRRMADEMFGDWAILARHCAERTRQAYAAAALLDSAAPSNEERPTP